MAMDDDDGYVPVFAHRRNGMQSRGRASGSHSGSSRVLRSGHFEPSLYRSELLHTILYDGVELVALARCFFDVVVIEQLVLQMCHLYELQLFVNGVAFFSQCLQGALELATLRVNAMLRLTIAWNSRHLRSHCEYIFLQFQMTV